jgi:hypothetical protein
LVTPGGFIHFKWADKFTDVIKDQKESQKIIPALKKLAMRQFKIFGTLCQQRQNKNLQLSIKFITFGIDSNNKDEYDNVVQCIQFVALFDTAKSKVIHWTGKSYPTTYDQKCRLIEFEDLKSHFVKVNKETVCLLGCHDLKIFSPRAKAIAGQERQQKINQFDELDETIQAKLNYSTSSQYRHVQNLEHRMENNRKKISFCNRVCKWY